MVNGAAMTGLPGLRAAREAKLLTQVELAAASGVNRSTVTDLERGVRRAQFRTIKQLAAALDVTPQELMVAPAPPASSGNGSRRKARQM